MKVRRIDDVGPGPAGQFSLAVGGDVYIAEGGYREWAGTFARQTVCREVAFIRSIDNRIRERHLGPRRGGEC